MSYNLYTYCENNPINYNEDPRKLQIGIIIDSKDATAEVNSALSSYTRIANVIEKNP